MLLNESQKISATDRFSMQLTRRVLHLQKAVMVLIIAVFISSLWGVSKLAFSNDYRIFFSDSNPELKDFEHFQSEYGQTDSVFFVIHNPAGSVFSSTIIPDIEAVVEQLSAIEHVARVEAITNFPDVAVENDELTVQAFIHDSMAMDEDDYAMMQQEALANSVIRGGMLSASADTTVLNIVFDLPQKSSFEVLDAADAVREVSRQFSELHPELKVALSGVIMLNTAFSEAGINDIQYLLPVMFLVLFAVLYFLMRSVYATVAIFVAIGYSCIFALGMAGFLGIPITVVSVSSMIIIMTLAVANGMHLLMSMVTDKDTGGDKACKIINSVKINFVPICLTSLTTIVSFLTLNFSDIPPYWHLGNITALGVFAAFVLSFLLMPVLMQGMPAVHRSVDHADVQQKRIMRLAHWVINHHRKILLGGTLLSVAIISAVPWLKFNDQFIHYFSHDIEFRRDAEFMEQHLSGLYTLEYLVPARSIDGIFESEYAKNVEAFTEWLRQQKEVRHVYSYTDVIKQINWNLHGKDERYRQLPEDPETAAQYFLMYQLSLSDDSSLESRISMDKSATRLSVLVNNLSSTEMQALVERADEWQKQHFPQYMEGKATGPAVMFAYISKRNISSMIQGNAVSIILISFILLVLLRSVTLGILSLLANAMPILLMFGVWTLVVGEVGMVGLTISAATLGIVVDDTIHFLTKYLRVKRDHDAREAILQTFTRVGVAIVSTSVVLVGGLSVLMASDFQLNQQAGMLTVICIILALLFDLLILPAALLFFARDKKMQNHLPVKV
jgi:uncharacterized protein